LIHRNAHPKQLTTNGGLLVEIVMEIIDLMGTPSRDIFGALRDAVKDIE
jgi:hypothetical protein